MSSFQLKGKIIEKYDLQVVSDRFRKREFVIEFSKENGSNTFTETIKFQLVQDRVDLIEPYSVGEEINVSFNIKGSKWEKDGRTNYFTNLDAWKIERNGAAQPANAPANESAPAMENPADVSHTAEAEDDLPF